ncbi:hypothetical protein L207DRAFT_543305 [Hyaloscypha variabilis F]|uniref:BTB domain transcription factor n=1 Tax=Hyaloscypha variabilis (strain UAMH 11265 / GT02V1 / F) TaxID=1149755 RepID=A0A2J6RVY7_HYAVF|nr:hypothetical protein L207DRAFT_543305 [Hyaloscypha variabilis F]
MATTRSSHDSAKSSPTSSKTGSATKARGKRSAETQSSPPAKRGRPAKKAKEQKTIEETLNGVEDDKDIAKQINGETEEQSNGDAKDSEAEPMEGTETQEQEVKDSTDAGARNAGGKPNGLQDGEKNAFDEVKADVGEVKEAAQKEQEEKSETIANNDKSVVEDKQRAAAIPSSILEKGVVYFFFRGRVGVEEPQGIEDVARSYIVLHPLPLGAKLGEGPLEDSGDARLLALPKKVLPTSGKDRFLVFVEKAKTTVKEIREQFASNKYATKTTGTSVTPAASPVAEGIYAITSTGRESHLVYQITTPSNLGEVQNDLGVRQKGSYVCSVKNPNAPGPANATLDNPAEYPESIQKKFRNLRWMPLEPELLDYQHTQLLLIGEGQGDFGRAVQEMTKDAKSDEKEKPEEEMEKLEEEDHDRVEHLKEDDPIFADLGLSAKEYPKIQASWST